ncbi:MarR family transcriptional regulator [Haladaptatus halobius]|uniref:MarR family transcriptional regulator n=1 Tax=Haladaptatus halobius TaxID=2884875 RepID=UPI001D0B448F|nr:helix-turn-helix domain-containing protein [Haladaptatus halobius]
MPDERERDTRGQYAEETTDEDILTTIRESEFPAVTARWVADTLGIERPSAHRRLEKLHEDGEVKRGKLSPRVVIWWIPNE